MFTGFEELSSSSGWRVIGKDVPDKIGACAGLEVNEAKKIFSDQ